MSRCTVIERKGKTLPYPSENGHTFFTLNKQVDLRFRFAKEVQEKFKSSLGDFRSQIVGIPFHIRLHHETK